MIKMPDINDITAIYSGRPGCMCGCRGKYYEGDSIKRVLSNMVRYAEKNGSTIVADGSTIYLEDVKRNYCIYLRE